MGYLSKEYFWLVKVVFNTTFDGSGMPSRKTTTSDRITKEELDNQ